MIRPTLRKSFLVAATALLLAGAAVAKKDDLPPITPVAEVDLQRYMGNWYVIANIPPGIEKGAHNSVENYRLNKDGEIPTTFTYRDDGFDGKLKTLESKAFVESESNAVWGVQFIWPFRAEYLIAWLDADYTRVIVARNKRDYLWLMARTPTIPDEEYEALKQRIAALGYDLAKLNKVPQRWPDPPRQPDPVEPF